jgi:hypothetical protein
MLVSKKLIALLCSISAVNSRLGCRVLKSVRMECMLFCWCSRLGGCYPQIGSNLRVCVSLTGMGCVRVLRVVGRFPKGCSMKGLPW